MKNDEKAYFSVDVEASGVDQQRFSMISLGSCLVEKLDETFYAEIKPLDLAFQERALRVGCLGLRCLEQLGRDDWTYNPRYEVFDSVKVMKHLQESGEEPAAVMDNFRCWVKEKADGRKPVFVASPVRFDHTYIARYFSLFSLQNPFEETKDPRQLYEELVANKKDFDIEQLGLKAEELEPSHNALEDALLQAKIFRALLGFIRNT